MNFFHSLDGLTLLKAYTFIILILFSHWFSDFILQTRWQAENKSKNNEALSRHLGTYSAGMLLLLYITPYFLFSVHPNLFNYLKSVILYVLLNGCLHWITDYFTSRATTHFYQKKDIHSFFGVIGFDQFIHVSTLLLTMSLLFICK